MPDETARSIVTLLAVTLGWVLGTFTSWIRQRHQRRQVRLALIQEIEDTRLIFLESKAPLEEALRITLQTGVYHAVPHQTPNHIYKNHFHLVAPYLKLTERMSFNRIYAFVDETNQQYRSINSALDELRFAELSEDFRTKYARLDNLIQGTYFNVCFAITAINHHIRNKKNVPSVTQQGEDELEGQIRSNIEETKKLASKSPDRGKLHRMDNHTTDALD